MMDIEWHQEIIPGTDERGRLYGWFLCVTGKQGDLRQMMRTKVKNDRDFDPSKVREMKGCITAWFRECGDEARAFHAQNKSPQ